MRFHDTIVFARCVIFSDERLSRNAFNSHLPTVANIRARNASNISSTSLHPAIHVLLVATDPLAHAHRILLIMLRDVNTIISSLFFKF